MCIEVKAFKLEWTASVDADLSHEHYIQVCSCLFTQLLWCNVMIRFTECGYVKTGALSVVSGHLIAHS